MSVSRWRLVENSPVNVAGKDGFRLHLKNQSRTGVSYQMLVTGFATPKGLYTMKYDAPTIRYFDLDKSNYETLIKSFAKKS
ncbi:MAG: hypothetical protein OQK51_16855 [Kangiellaceae bacterium]|nr:hypothetical protein [Kangiellaceae bacterium]